MASGTSPASKRRLDKLKLVGPRADPAPLQSANVKSNAWHIITSEYPPQFGGVSDYTGLVAAGLAAAGDEVHVWCPSVSRATVNGTEDGAAKSVADEIVADELVADRTFAPHVNAGGADKSVIVHRELGSFTSADLRRAGSLLDQFSGPRRLLVQWVPHGYGYRSMNLPFCFWLRNRAASNGDRVELMVHEPYLAFGEGSWKQRGAAAVHRLMTAVLMKTADRVWISIPAWEKRLRPYAFGRALEFRWLPIPNGIPVVDNPARVKATRARYAAEGERLVGHFGAYDRNTTELLLGCIPLLLQNNSECKLLLLGRGSEETREKLIAAHPASQLGSPPARQRSAQPAGQVNSRSGLAVRVHATGTLSAGDVSLHLSACDVLLQPYLDGVSSRRGSVMAGLAHGVPIVTNKGRLTEGLWAESGAVALASGTDAESLLKTTVELLADEPGRRRLSNAGKRLYQERFAIEHVVGALRAEI
jgi:glycosyltransferase involved in cell wall biosynthesis